MIKDVQQTIRMTRAVCNVVLCIAVGVFSVIFRSQQSVAQLHPASQDPSVTQERITVLDVLSGSPVPADERIAYGDHPMQFGDLRMPGTQGPWPVAVLIHGGCWSDIATLQYFDRVAVAITDLGIMTWNIEYRPVDVEGGGWPNTFLDVAHGIDKLRDIAADYNLDLDHVITLGHSAGGHLALWAAARPRIYDDSDLFMPNPLPITGVVSLAGIPELRRYREIDPPTCGADIVDQLMGGGPRDVPGRYLAGSPFQMLPLDVPQRHITGSNDEIVPLRQVSRYNYEAQSAGDDSELIVVPAAGHYEVVWPGTAAWKQVEMAVKSLLSEQ
jgi:acetyl esterase/lipase